MPEDSYSHLTACSFSHTLWWWPYEGRGRSASWKSRATETRAPPTAPVIHNGSKHSQKEKIHLPGMQASQREEATGEGSWGVQWSSPMEGDRHPRWSLGGPGRIQNDKVAGSCVPAAILAPGTRGWGNQMLLCPFLSPKASLIPYSGQG